MRQDDGLSVVFGEVLFDCFGEREVLGGAPLNFAWHLRQFGRPVAMVSAVGRDRMGAEARRFMDDADIRQAWVADRPEATGTVDVSLQQGEPVFTIHENVAWDHIELPSGLAANPPLVYFGTAAQRTAGNRETLSGLLALQPRHCLCDINLRAPFYNDPLILDCLRQATLLKLNDDEWPIIRQITGLSTPAALAEAYDLQMIALTKGGDGAELHWAGGSCREAGRSVEVVDTVGAGDAFCAAFAAGVLAGAEPAEILQAACAAGAAMVQQRGGQGRLPGEVASAFTTDDV